MPIQVVTSENFRFDPNVRIQAMLSDDEKALYFGIASRYRGEGAVVEIGPWLGASTSQICAGLETSGRRWKLCVLDRFIWSPLYAGRYPSVALHASDSFLPLFESNLRNHSSNMDIHVGDLRDIGTTLPLDRQVELLFIDAPKTWRSLWIVLNHFAPWLAVGSTIVLQDFLHITSRQIAWLMASIPEVHAVEIVRDGTSVAFRVSAPIENFSRDTPSDIRSIDTTRLVDLCGRLAEQLPRERFAELAAGLSLDLFDRRENQLAYSVLDRSVVETGFTSIVEPIILRLLGRSPGRERPNLLQALAHLRKQVDPTSIFRAHERFEKSHIAAEDSGSEKVRREESLRTAHAMKDANSANALALRHTAFHGFRGDHHFRRIHSTLAAAVRLSVPNSTHYLSRVRPGDTVLEIGDIATLNGPVVRAFGASRFTAILREGGRARRTYVNRAIGSKIRVATAPSDLEEIDPCLHYMESSDFSSERGVDLVAIYPRPTREDLLKLLAIAMLSVRIGGTISVTWTNPRAGRMRPSASLESDETTNNTRSNIFEWNHLKDVAIAVPTIDTVRTLVSEFFEVDSSTAEVSSPEAALSLTPRILRKNPALTAHDLLYESETMIGRRI